MVLKAYLHVSTLGALMVFDMVSSGALAQSTISTQDIRQSFDVNLGGPPQIAGTGTESQLVYELHLTSFSRSPATITKFAIHDELGQPIIALEGDALKAAFHLLGPEDNPQQLVVPAGRRAILYVNAPLGNGKPKALSHRISYDIGDKPAELALASVPVDAARVPVLGPPLRGGPWVGLYDPAMEWGHRRVIYATEGRSTIPGRFAIDWIRLDKNGRMTKNQGKGGGTRADQYYGYGADILAVADGTVVAVRDDFQQMTALKDLPRVPIGDATGNYVALDIGDGRIAFYEHVLPEIPVKIGDKVKRGQVIAKLGITGQGSEPHLHFHVADSKSPLGGDGRAWLMEGVTIIGRYGSIAEAVSGKDWGAIKGFEDQVGTATLPPPNMVVRFPDT